MLTDQVHCTLRHTGGPEQLQILATCRQDHFKACFAHNATNLEVLLTESQKVLQHCYIGVSGESWV